MAARNMFLLRERIFLLLNYYRFDEDHSEIFGEFERCFPNRPLLTRNYLYKLYRKFQTIGIVDDVLRSGRPQTVGCNPS